MSGSGRFGGHDVRRGMDVYDEDGLYLGSVVRVEIRPDDGLASVCAGGPGGAMVVGEAWRPWGRRRVDVRRVKNVSMERVILSHDV
jgi:sporulation protein YlmC with PRC-barrel domain